MLAWFAFTEDLVGQWAREPTMTRAELLTLLRDVLDRLTPSQPVEPAARDVGARSAASSGGGCSWATTSGALAPVASIDFFTVRAVDVDVLLPDSVMISYMISSVMDRSTKRSPESPS